MTSNAAINSVILTSMVNMSGSFAGLPSAPGGGLMGLSGVAKICLVFTLCDSANVTVPLTPSGGAGFGVGGTQAVVGAVSLTMQHNPWTIGQPTITIHTPNSAVTTPALPGGYVSPGWPAHVVHSPGSATHVVSPTGRGTVQLVTVSKAFTSLTGSRPELPLIGVLRLRFAFVPEPGTLLLLGSGVVTLAAVRRRRHRR